MSASLDRVTVATSAVLDWLAQPDSLSRVARHVIPCSDVPCSRWSLFNRILVAVNGTDDARGIRQWNSVGRSVSRGRHAFWIMAPKMVTVAKRTESESSEEVEIMRILTGFVGVPVFRYEDTEGANIPQAAMTPANPPPLLSVADRWGVKVKYSGWLHSYYGYYQLRDHSINLCTSDATTFFHEMAHAAQHRLWPESFKSGQLVGQEIEAEFSAAILAELYGVALDQRGNAADYIARYAAHWSEGGKPRTAHDACMRVLSHSEKIVRLIVAESAETVEKGE